MLRISNRLLSSARPWLEGRAAQEKVVYFARIRNSSECDFLCESCRRCDHGKKKNHDAEKKRIERERVTHTKSDAVFYSQNEKIGRKYKRAIGLAET